MAAAADAQPDILTKLAERLLALGVKPCTTLEELSALKPDDEAVRTKVTAAYVLQPRLVVRYSEVIPSMLIYDATLGALGLVEVLTPGGIALETQMSMLFDRAAYLRQICLTLAGNASQRALTVELVIVFPKDLIVSAPGIAGELLRFRAKETGYLETIGVGLLFEQPNGTLDEQDVTRAFPWLLSETRKWFNAGSPRSTAANNPSKKPWKIALTNYRQAGSRTFELRSDVNFHVLHGYNGSGKSTFTEALELLLTGSIERIDNAGEKQYFPVVRYRRSESPLPKTSTVEEITDAKVTLEIAGEAQVVHASATVFNNTDPAAETPDRKREWNNSPPTGGLQSAASFRLDQVLMEALVSSTEPERAAVFLKAFFPQDRPRFEALQQANTTATSAFAALPKPVVDAMQDLTDKISWVGQNLVWTQAPPSEWSSSFLETVRQCLPVTPEQLDLIIPLTASLQPVVSNLQKPTRPLEAAEEELRKLDRALADARNPAAEAQAHLTVALQAFKDFNGWRAAGHAETIEDFEVALNRWLSLQALLDLVTKEFEVQATIAAARAQGWHPESEEERLFDDVQPTPARIEALRAARTSLGSQLAKARSAVEHWGTESASNIGATEGQVTPPPRRLRKEEVASLNRIGDWLPSARSNDPSAKGLGDLFAEAIDVNDRRTRGYLTIGTPGSLDKASSEASAMLEACKRIVELKPDLADGAAPMFIRCRDAHKAALEVIARQKEVQQSFLSQITGDSKGHPLIRALNELRALFKPAPWAYQDISLRAYHRGAGAAAEQLAIRTADNSRAELRLNTAEMNSFTIALFLLCAPTLDNPLRLLLLDDPLQNMDELTVAAISRGLAKLMRIYPQGWRIAALFHGEGDLYRVSSEVPSAVYRLPWLSPSPEDKPVPPITAERAESTWERRQQLLSDIT